MARDEWLEVEVMHLLNPYLIWVQVTSQRTKETVPLMQIGIYGIFPCERIPGEGNVPVVKRTSDWKPVTSDILRTQFSEASRVWFAPTTEIITSSSVFGHGIHKFGKFVIQKKDQKLRLVSTYLLQSGFAENDFTEFRAKLQTKTLYPALDAKVKEDIIRCLTIAVNYKLIIQYRKRAKKQQQMKNAKAMQKADDQKSLEGAKPISEKDVKEILEKKMKDLQLCKADAGEPSVGRACRKTDAKAPNAAPKRVQVLPQRKLSDVNANNNSVAGPSDAGKKMAADRKMKDDEIDSDDDFEFEPQLKPAPQARVNRLPAAMAPNITRQVIMGPPGVNPYKLGIINIVPENIRARNGYQANRAPQVPQYRPNIPINRNVSLQYVIPNGLVNPTPAKKPQVIIESCRAQARNNRMVANVTTKANMSRSDLLQRKLNNFKEAQRAAAAAFPAKGPVNHYCANNFPLSDESMKAMLSRLIDMSGGYNPAGNPIPPRRLPPPPNPPPRNINVNPFQNVNPFMSVFVNKLIAPVLLVHPQSQDRIEASMGLSDIHFNSHIHTTLRNMRISGPMIIQYVSWQTILRGYSFFMIAPRNSGKTMGYVPAVCRHVSDFRGLETKSSAPFCIIVCASSSGVTSVSHLARLFLGIQEKVLPIYSGMDDLTITSCLLNGCDLLVTTPTVLVRMLSSPRFGLNLNKLAIIVLDDCERLNEVYLEETKFITRKIKEVERTRVDKVLKVQYVLASRVWCEFMRPLALKAPNAVMCFSAFQECVLYSKADTTINFVKSENKINTVLNFMENDIDITKRTVIVCKHDKEVQALEEALKSKYTVFACNKTMSVNNLYKLNRDWDEYNEPVSGPVLVCCDGNLTHMNITNAHYLIHYSMPALHSMFCKRFAVLCGNYASIFREPGVNVKIKVLIEEKNVREIPKVLNFVKRCTNNVPHALEVICQKIQDGKNLRKAKAFVPICNTLLAVGKCADMWNCVDRHAVFKEFDEPKPWMPTRGVVTFQILYYHSANMYSARLLTNVVNGVTTRYPPNYSTLSLKLGLYFSKECNRRLHGIPKLGDICGIALNPYFVTRCQVFKFINNYTNGNPNEVLVRLIDEERIERTRDIFLYYIPEELKIIQSHVVQVRLSNVLPKDKDLGFSILARNQLKVITDKDVDIFMRGKISLTIGNCIFVESLEACQHLPYLRTEVVKHDFKKNLLERHGLENKDHIRQIRSLCKIGGLDINTPINEEPNEIKAIQKLPEVRWAHLEEGDFSVVLFASAENPERFFIRLEKFESCMQLLIKDIKRHIDQGGYERIEKVERGDIVLAQFPGDGTYERARVESVSEEKVNCFFVDQGDWKYVALNDLAKITPNFITKIPFQAIECRLVGVKPLGEKWTDLATNWFSNNCYDSKGLVKQLFVKYLTKEIAECTGGHKYGVVLVDTNTDTDVVMNQLMIDLNLAQVDEGEKQYLDDLGFEREVIDEIENSDDDDDKDWEKPKQVVPYEGGTDNNTDATVPFEDIFLKKPIRSVPLVGSDDEGSEDSDSWNLHLGEEFMKLFNPMFAQATAETETVKTTNENVKENLPAIAESNQSECMIKPSVSSDFEVIQLPKEKDLDSDDLSSPGTSNVSISEPMTVIAETRKPKVNWRQDKTTVSFKIQILGVDDYNLEVRDRRVKFSAVANKVDYAFEFQLYGVIDEEKTTHCNKGQYISVKMVKTMKKTWLTLARDGAIKKWIVYDVDSITVSSDEEDSVDSSFTNIVQKMHYAESDTEDEDFCDDLNYNYKDDLN